MYNIKIQSSIFPQQSQTAWTTTRTSLNFYNFIKGYKKNQLGLLLVCVSATVILGLRLFEKWFVSPGPLSAFWLCLQNTICIMYNRYHKKTGNLCIWNESKLLHLTVPVTKEGGKVKIYGSAVCIEKCCLSLQGGVNLIHYNSIQIIAQSVSTWQVGTELCAQQYRFWHITYS